MHERRPEKVALCLFVKTKEPRIEGHFGKRRGVDLAQYVAKGLIIVGAMALRLLKER